MDFTKYSYEDLANALYLKGKEEGYSKVTDKTKWREPVMAEKLNHIAHTKISAGASSDEYGSDAYDQENNIYAEYKTTTISDNDEATARKLLGIQSKSGRSTKEYRIGGIYNGAYKQSAIDAYSKIDHYFGVFFEERCVLIAKIPTATVIAQLIANNNNRKEGKTTNLSGVSVPLSEAKIVYDNRSYIEQRFFG